MDDYLSSSMKLSDFRFRELMSSGGVFFGGESWLYRDEKNDFIDDCMLVISAMHRFLLEGVLSCFVDTGVWELKSRRRRLCLWASLMFFL
jgi:hypothetical protein